MHLSVWLLARAGWTCLPLCHNGEALGTGRHVTRTWKVHEDTDIPADVSTNQPLYSQKPNKKSAHRTQSPLKTGRNLTRMTSSRKVHPVQELTLQSLVPPGPLRSGESRAHTHVCAHAPLHTLLLRKNSPGQLAASDLDIIWNIPDFYTFLLETQRCKPPLEDRGVVPVLADQIGSSQRAKQAITLCTNGVPCTQHKEPRGWLPTFLKHSRQCACLWAVVISLTTHPPPCMASYTYCVRGGRLLVRHYCAFSELCTAP